MYKIKFLEANKDTEAGKPLQVTVDTIYGDGLELSKIAQYWRSLGFKRVLSIEVLEDSELSYKEVVEKFYPEFVTVNNKKIPLPEIQREVKDELLSIEIQEPVKLDIEYLVKEFEAGNLPKSQEKELRKVFFEKAKNADITVAKNIKTEQLLKIV